MAKEELVNLHDELAKKFLTNVEAAKEFLQIHLPKEIQAKCDLSTLTIESGSYVDEDLRKRFSDVVYKLDLLDKSSCVYAYLLLEHQSTPVKLMPVRILKYTLEILQVHINKYGQDCKLPVIIPMVLYNGEESPYPYATDILELCADKELMNNAPLGTFRLIDLTLIPDEEILQHGKIALLEMLEKHIRIRDFKQIEPLILAAIIVAYGGGINKSLFDSALSYLTNAREGNELEPLFKDIIENISEYEETIMTYAEELRREGELRGEQKAQAEKQEIAKNLLKSGVDAKVVANAIHLSAQQIDELKKDMH